MIPFLAPGLFAPPTAALSMANSFAATLWTGNGAIRTITSSIAADMEFIKARNVATGGAIFDKMRGAAVRLFPDTTGVEATQADSLTAFGATGFDLGADANNSVNQNTTTYVGWGFRRDPGFFDIQTWTGDGTTGRVIPHSLGASPGMIIVKCRSAVATTWRVFHRSIGTGGNGFIDFNGTAAATIPDTGAIWGNGVSFMAPTSTGFTISSNGNVNTSGQAYVAYLFGHDTTSSGRVQCGTFTTDGAGNATVTGLPAAPQAVLLRRTDAVGDTYMVDTTRGWAAGADKYVRFNDPGGESAATDLGAPTSDGFTFANVSPSSTYIYMALRS